MAQIKFTLNYEFGVGPFSEDRNQAFGELMIEKLKNRGLHGVDIVISDSHQGLGSAIHSPYALPKKSKAYK